MNILLTGGTGLLGRSLCQALGADGHRLTVLSRRPEQVSRLCGAGVAAMANLDEWAPEQRFDAVINLAGAPIIDLPWSNGRKHTLWESRIALTDQLVAAIARADQKPSVFLSGSAIGYYGDCGEFSCSDAINATAAKDFGARLCAAWETAASVAEAKGVRVCLLRTGLVLSPQGGILGRMKLPFKLGLGGQLGDGLQWMSWIQIDDWVRAVKFLLEQTTERGVFNLCAPEPVRNAAFTTAFAHSLGRSAPLRLPAFLLQVALGQRAYLLLGGQRVLPERLQALGFSFHHTGIADALASVR